MNQTMKYGDKLITGSEWYKIPETESFYKKEDVAFFKIKSEYEDESITKLSSICFLQIDKEEAEKITGNIFQKEDIILLVRGVVFNKNIQDFIILSDGTNLLIGHISLGTSTNIYKFPIVLKVKKVPINVYSSCKQVS